MISVLQKRSSEIFEVEMYIRTVSPSLLPILWDFLLQGYFQRVDRPRWQWSSWSPSMNGLKGTAGTDANFWRHLPFRAERPQVLLARKKFNLPPKNVILHFCLGLGSIGTTSMDRQSRKIDVQHERTSIAELDSAPLPPLFSLPPKYKRAYPIL